MTDLAPLIVGLLAATVRIAAIYIIASLGELLAERSGVINLGTEGMMILGAFASFLVAYTTSQPLLGIFAGAIVGAIAGLLFAFLTIRLRSDQVITGIAFSLAGLGLTTFYFRLIFGTGTSPPHLSATIPIVEIPILGQIPFLGQILFQHDPFVYIALLLPVVFAFILFRTSYGLKIRATGEDPSAADAAGVNVFRIRYLCVMLGALMAGIAGAMITTVQFNMFLYNVTAGRGYTAVALCILGSWRPNRILLGALLFGGAEVLGLRLQAIGFDIPYQFPLMLPYVLTIVALLVASRKIAGPAALGKNYRRGEH